MNHQDLKENESQYERRLRWWNKRGSSSMGQTVLMPDENASEMACEAFHELMTNRGYDGVEYAQEALHMNGDYFDDYFDSKEECMEDFQRFKEIDK